jgi:Outer membrane protein beta-barrel domain
MVQRMLGSAIIILALSVPTQDVLAEQTFRFELTPFIGYRVGGSFEDEDTGESVDLDESGSYGLIFNIVEKANTQYEFSWSHQGTSVDLTESGGNPAKLDLDIDLFQLGGTYLFDGNFARPYIVATLGAAHYRSKSEISESETYFAFSIGGGWKLWPTRRFGLRLEGRYYGTLVQSNSKIFCGSSPQNAGCLIQTSGKLLSQWEVMAGGVFRF